MSYQALTTIFSFLICVVACFIGLFIADIHHFSKTIRDILLPLGVIQSVPVEDDITIINMVAQHDIKSIDNVPPIRYESLEVCLSTVYKLAYEQKYSIHMPRIGAVRSGGDWDKIEKIIKKYATVETYIYTLENEKNMWECEYEDIK